MGFQYFSTKSLLDEQARAADFSDYQRENEWHNVLYRVDPSFYTVRGLIHIVRFNWIFHRLIIPQLTNLET